MQSIQISILCIHIYNSSDKNIPIAGCDENDLPSTKKYPDHTLELMHNRRRAYYITAADEDDKKEWVEMFRTCCRKASGTKWGDVTLDVVDSIKERCLQWIGRERKLTLILNTTPLNPDHPYTCFTFITSVNT